MGAVAALMSGCSSDATRFGDPFGSPFSTASADQVPVRTHVASAGDIIPAGRMPPVTSQALAPRSSSVAALTPLRSAPQTAFREPVSAETTGSIEPGPVRTAANGSFGGWSSAGGTPIQVADGDTADVLAKRYGVPTTALLQVNGLRSATDVRPGARITIPIYSASAAQVATSGRVAQSAPTIAARPTRAAHLVPTRAPAGAALAARTPALGKLHPVDRLAAAPMKAAHASSTLASAAPIKGKSLIAKAALPAAAPGKLITRTALVPSVTAKAAPAVVATAPAKFEKVAAAAPAVAAPQAAAAPAADTNPEFRWPARGRIIQSFKGGSGGNDGINIAVPEGTSVKAAEGGVVAYAGSELKGYGNLVLIRHPNGFVSAYANNGQIDVKRGETVKRGQEIAKSGQSGNVSSPQLHFELRKGSTPVDPTQYLAGL